jgi:uncharacterized protein (DUF58 family)
MVEEDRFLVLRKTWSKLRGWRRVRFTTGGAVFSVGTLAIGFAAINTGNNLLFLLLGAMFGFISLSSWLSERTLRQLEIRRRTPRGVAAGRPTRITYYVTNRKRRFPTLAIYLIEEGLPVPAFISRVGAGDSAAVASENFFVQRGVYPLRTLTLSTSFPFGLFTKERDVPLPGELIIWPRSDRPVQLPTPPGGRGKQQSAHLTGGALGSRGEYRGLREYRAGDDPRDIHWRTTARIGTPVTKEYDQDATEAVRICLDTRGEPGDAAESAVEVAAALAAQAYRAGRRFGITTCTSDLAPAVGSGQLEVVLDLLARVDFDPSAPALAPPSDPLGCVLVSMSGTRGGSFGAYINPAGGSGALPYVYAETSDADRRTG